MQLALFAALIVIMSATPFGYIPLGFMRATIIHVPVILGSVLLGPKQGAVLGFIFGPLGAALWYFFRKMYKHAFILAAIGIVVTVATSLITGPVLTEINPADIFDYIAGEGAEDTLIPELDSIEFNISNTITNIVDLATAVICGLFTHSWYKKHIKNSILNYRSKGIDPRYYPIGLASLGGTSGGMLTLGIFIMIFSENLATIFTKLIYMI
jgi:hypothetical protein